MKKAMNKKARIQKWANENKSLKLRRIKKVLGVLNNIHGEEIVMKKLRSMRREHKIRYRIDEGSKGGKKIQLYAIA